MQLTAVFPVAIDEDSVRRLCGTAVFAQADALQRAGHVLGPKIGDDDLGANVRGTWQRVDGVTVQGRAGRLFPRCARDGAEFCRHAGALLLQWLRDPASFAAAADPNETTPMPPGYAQIAKMPADDETPVEELIRLLDTDTVNHLREIGSHRGARSLGSKKVDVVRNLATVLADPAGIDTAISILTDDERIALDTAQIVGGEPQAQPAPMSEVFRALGGRGEMPIVPALDAGLVITPNQGYYGPLVYLVPRSVAARLAPLGNIVTRTNVKADKAALDNTRLGIVEMLQVIALESLAAPIATEQGRQGAALPEVYGGIPAGFAMDPVDVAVVAASGGYAARATAFLLTPRRLLAETALTRLAASTAQSTDAVEFVARLMLALDVAQTTPNLLVQTEHLQALLDLAPAARLRRLVSVWLRGAGSYELGLLAGANGRVRLRWNQQYSYAAWSQPLQPAVASAARLIVRLIGRMVPDVWYDLRSFVELVERLAPAAAPGLTQLRSGHQGMQAVSLTWLSDRGEEQPLAPRTPEGWSRFLSVLVGSLLAGPLRWLGLVDAVVRPDRSGAFQVKRVAGALTGRDLSTAEDEPARQLIVSDDLTVLVPAQTTDVSIHGRLARAGELFEASAEGLRYRLTPVGLQRVFDGGTTGPEFVQFLTERAGESLPTAVTAELDRWWSGYGAIRLYDELTLIEFGDDLLLSELTAVTSLRSTVIHTFSPRLIAVDPARADDLVAELTSRGYAPRVVEEV